MTNVAKSYKTNGTMDIQAVIQPGTSHYVLQWSGGGEIPKSLEGKFTSLSFVDTQVATYVNSNKQEPKLDEAEKAVIRYEKKQAKKEATTIEE
jgi:hypothetical protein